jgi:RNA-directed DNA polymerase
LPLTFGTELFTFHDPTKNYIYRGDPSLKSLIPKSKSLFFSGGTGLPIGNLTSQFFANIYLNELDHFITDNQFVGGPGFLHYIRYVDDFVIINGNKEKLRSMVPIVNEYLQFHLKLVLHPKKIILQPIKHGVDFLGYFIKPSHTLVRQRVVRRFKDKLHRRQNPKDGLFSINDVPMIKSYLGHLSHANTFKLNREMTFQGF